MRLCDAGVLIVVSTRDVPMGDVAIMIDTRKSVATKSVESVSMGRVGVVITQRVRRVAESDVATMITTIVASITNAKLVLLIAVK